MKWLLEERFDEHAHGYRSAKKKVIRIFATSTEIRLTGLLKKIKLLSSHQCHAFCVYWIPLQCTQLLENCTYCLYLLLGRKKACVFKNRWNCPKGKLFLREVTKLSPLKIRCKQFHQLVAKNCTILTRTRSLLFTQKVRRIKIICS